MKLKKQILTLTVATTLLFNTFSPVISIAANKTKSPQARVIKVYDAPTKARVIKINDTSGQKAPVNTNNSIYINPNANRLTADELALARAINDYRQANGLNRLAISFDLTKTARTHTRDSHENRPFDYTDYRGIAGNLHSWSAAGNWTPVVYTPDHAYAEQMWNKPYEVAGYQGEGYEISIGADYYIPVNKLMELWKNSPSHHQVMLEFGSFEDPYQTFQAMGVSMQNGYAHVWFGYVADDHNFSEYSGILQ